MRLTRDVRPDHDCVKVHQGAQTTYFVPAAFFSLGRGASAPAEEGLQVAYWEKGARLEQVLKELLRQQRSLLAKQGEAHY